MVDGPFSMVVMIVLIAVGAGVVKTWLETKANSGADAETRIRMEEMEREVLKLVASGLSSKAIARTLDISPKTVETHRSRLMTKLDLHSVADLVRYAVETGFLSK